MKRWLFLLVWLMGCEDPVHDDKVSALGPEPGPYETGPLHRAGEPCTVCHGGEGPADPEFDLAGTVFLNQGDLMGLPGARVVVYDQVGNSEAYYTNDVGTFVAPADELGLSFPLWVAIEANGKRVRMETPIFRARSCAECHMDPRDQSSMGHVYLEASP